MKKFLSLSLVAMLWGGVALAQEFRWGVTGAMNVSRYAVESAGVSLTNDSRIGFKAGLRVEMDAPFITDGVYFDSELVLSSRGTKIKAVVNEADVDLTSRPYYLEMPIHIGYSMPVGSNFNVYASFGPYLALGIFGTERLSSGDIYSKPDTFSNDNLKRFDFGLGVRAGVAMFDHYRIYLGYDWGLVNIAQDSTNDKINNRNFYVGMAYMF